jgi:hypothetical protein
MTSKDERLVGSTSVEVGTVTTERMIPARLKCSANLCAALRGIGPLVILGSSFCIAVASGGSIQPSPTPTALRDYSAGPVTAPKIVSVSPIGLEPSMTAADLTGAVLLEAVIDETGRISELNVRSSLRATAKRGTVRYRQASAKATAFTEAAKASALRWRFTPGTYRGEPVRCFVSFVAPLRSPDRRARLPQMLVINPPLAHETATNK